MDMERSFGRMGLTFKAILITVIRSMATFNGQMTLPMLAHFYKVSCRVKASLLIRMDAIIKAIGKIIRCMDLASLNGKMVNSFKVIMFLIKNMDLVYLN